MVKSVTDLELKVEVYSRLDDFGIAVRIFKVTDDGRYFLARVNENGELEFKEHQPGEIVRPTLLLPGGHQMLQKMFDAARKEGVINVPDLEKELAKERAEHLSDIRMFLQIVKDLLVIVNLEGRKETKQEKAGCIPKIDVYPYVEGTKIPLRKGD